jgi:hypothetical protein
LTRAGRIATLKDEIMLKERLRAAADQFEAMAWPDPNRR